MQEEQNDRGVVLFWEQFQLEMYKYWTSEPVNKETRSIASEVNSNTTEFSARRCPGEFVMLGMINCNFNT